MVTKSAAPDPLAPMLAHALALLGDDADRRTQVTRFFKEMGPVVRQLWEASFSDDGSFDESRPGRPHTIMRPGPWKSRPAVGSDACKLLRAGKLVIENLANQVQRVRGLDNPHQERPDR